MVPDTRIYQVARSVIRHHGDKAGTHADRRMQHFLTSDDPQAAGIWLMIGLAIEQLRHRPAGTVH